MMAAVRTILMGFVPLVLASLALTQATTPPPAADKDPFVGTWQSNRGKSRPKLNKVDATYIRTISRDGDYVVSSGQYVDSKSRPATHNKIRCDGHPYSVPFGSISCRYTAANIIDGETTSLTQETTYWTREVSADGLEMKFYTYKNKNREKIKSIWVLDRVR